MTRYARATPPRRVPARRLPRGTSLAAVAAAAVLVALPAAAADPATEVPPAGSVIVAVLQSDGLVLLPVGIATVPPLACDPKRFSEEVP